MTEVRARLAELRAQGKTWEQIAELMDCAGHHKNADAWRKTLHPQIDKRRAGTDLVRDAKSNGHVIPTETADKLLLLAKGKPKRFEAVAGAMHMSDGELFGTIGELQDKGHDIQVENGLVWLNTTPKICDSVVEHEHKQRHFRIMVVSDTHLGSRFQQLTALHEAYDDAVRKDVDFVFHVGDLVDGFYRDRLSEVFLIGYDLQLDYAVKHYPVRTKRDGSTLMTYMISGNHDGTFKRDMGADIVLRFAQLRDDVKYLGEGACQYMLTPRCKVDLMHPLDGSAYAVSYSAQKIADAYTGGEKPNILLIGHHHKQMCFSYRNIHICEVPCLEEQTLWMKRKRLYAVVGWLVLDIDVDEHGSVTSFRHEFCQKYVMRKEDY